MPVVLALLFIEAAVHAQNEPTKPLVERAAFDQIILREDGKQLTIDVFPLEIDRPAGELPKEGEIEVRLVDRPAEEYVVSWRDIVQIRFHDQILFGEASRRAGAKEFDEAYALFLRLQSEYPHYPGLTEAIDRFLLTNAVALHQDKELDRALATLLSLASRNPKYPGLSDALGRIAGEAIETRLRQQDFAAARGILDLWRSEFKDVGAPVADAWQARFEAAAARQLEQARELVANRDYVGARRVIARATAIWPDHPEARALLAQIQRDHPSMTVGVFEKSPSQPRYRIDDWASRRASRLVDRLLVEQVGFNAEGGVYRSPYGELAIDESSTRLTLTLKPFGAERPFTTDGLVRLLLRMADPDDPRYRGDFASLLKAVSVTAPDTAELEFVHPHVRLDSLLQVEAPESALAGGDSASPQAPRTVINMTTDQDVLFEFEGGGQGTDAPRSIVERTFSRDDEAVAALLAGEIDVLDRVPPWQVERLRSEAQVKVEAYKLPTLHVLIPNPKSPLLARREFRRALCFGINREWIVQRMLLGGNSQAGFQVISGPFPAGVSLGDPIRYGYNNLLVERPFEPRLATVLATVAASALASPEGDDEAPVGEIPSLVLAHPADPVARIMCQAIGDQLGKLGIGITLRECGSEELDSGRVEYDLRYAELAMWEPLADAHTLFAPGGPAGAVASPYLDGLLRRLSEATNWRDVRSCLSEIHETVRHELPVIPLWQTVNYFAYRTNVQGIGSGPMTLYQDVDRWSAAGEQVARDGLRGRIGSR